MEHLMTVRRIVTPEPGGRGRDPEIITYSGLLREMRDLIEMLPDDMVEKAADAVLLLPEYPDWPDMFTQAELDRFEVGKRKFRNGELRAAADNGTSGSGIHETTAKYIEQAQARHKTLRKDLHRLTKYMSGELLDEAVETLKSEALLDIPYELTQEEWEDLHESDKDIERGDVLSWEEFMRDDDSTDV